MTFDVIRDHWVGLLGLLAFGFNIGAFGVSRDRTFLWGVGLGLIGVLLLFC